MEVNDVISRQAVIDAVQQHREDVLGGYEYDEGVAFVYAAAHNHIIEVIKRLPSAQPEQQWIPVVKKPIEKGLMLVTYNDGDVDLLKQPTAYRRSDIVAWMPIEPWRGAENE